MSFWKCWLCFCLLCFSCHCCATTGSRNQKCIKGDLAGLECFKAFKNGWNTSGCKFWDLEVWCFYLSGLVSTLFGFGSSTMVTIIPCDLSLGQMIWFVPPLFFTPNRTHLRARKKKWCSCHNLSTVRRDGSACFCYYVFNLSQNTIQKPPLLPSFSQTAAWSIPTSKATQR